MVLMVVEAAWYTDDSSCTQQLLQVFQLPTQLRQKRRACCFLWPASCCFSHDLDATMDDEPNAVASSSRIPIDPALLYAGPASATPEDQGTASPEPIPSTELPFLDLFGEDNTTSGIASSIASTSSTSGTGEGEREGVVDRTVEGTQPPAKRRRGAQAKARVPRAPRATTAKGTRTNGVRGKLARMQDIPLEILAGVRLNPVGLFRPRRMGLMGHVTCLDADSDKV